MRVRVKICGVTSREAAQAAVDAGVDALGFVLSESPRQLDVPTAASLALGLPPFVTRVAVFHHPQRSLVEAACEAFAPAWLQTEPESLAGWIPPRGARVLPVFHDDGAAVAAYLDAWTGAGRPVLHLEGAGRGGRGIKPDWSLAADLARRHPVVLAGGLTPENVGQAIRAVRPYAVDVSSGVESSPGQKDPARVSAFVAAVRAAERECA